MKPSPDTPGTAPAAPTGSGDILPGTRTAIALLFVLAAANGIFLYLWPSQALTNYAWPVFPPLNAGFLGAGYLSGAVAAVFALVTVRRWRSIESMLWPLAAFTALMLSATALQASDFDWQHQPLTWLWTGGYTVVLVGASVVWWRQARASATSEGPARAVGPLVTITSALGVLLVLLGALVFVDPGAAGNHWPWAITSLLARVFGGWYVLEGGILIAAGVGSRTWAAAFIPYLTVAAWSFLLAILPVTYGATMQTTVTAFWFWLGLQLVTLLLSGFGARQSLRMMRTTGA